MLLDVYLGGNGLFRRIVRVPKFHRTVAYTFWKGIQLKTGILVESRNFTVEFPLSQQIRSCHTHGGFWSKFNILDGCLRHI